jgi:hypothetical protein
MEEFQGLTNFQAAKDTNAHERDENQGRFSLIHVGKHAAAGNAADPSQTGLLHDIARGLLQPNVPLSAQAAAQLRRQQAEAGYGVLQHNAGDLLKFLPVELLYDDAGLQLFDQVTMHRQAVTECALPGWHHCAALSDVLADEGAYDRHWQSSPGICDGAVGLFDDTNACCCHQCMLAWAVAVAGNRPDARVGHFSRYSCAKVLTEVIQ